MTLEQLKSAILNDLKGGLSNLSANLNLSMEQLEDDIIDERLIILKEYSLKNMIPVKDLLMSINCIKVDCLALDKCPCNTNQSTNKPIAHVEIPQILNDFGEDSVEFFGSVDKGIQFKVYTSTAFQYHKFLRRGANKAYIYIEPVPNANNMYDAWIFNAPFIKIVSLTAIFKDPRQLWEFDCCANDETINYNFIDNEIKKRVTEKKLRYYRQFGAVPTNNDQVAR